MTEAAILMAGAIGFAAVSVFAAVKSDGAIGGGWAFLAFVLLVSSCSMMQ